MTDYGRFMRERATANALTNEVIKGKKARQAVLKRVRKQRTLVLKRRTARDRR
jgi:hypothetical protein